MKKCRMRLKVPAKPQAPQSGRQDKYVYYMRGGKQCRRRYVVPKDPRTAAQRRSRRTFAAASLAWSHSRRLTNDQRQGWRVTGAKKQSRIRLAQSGPLTGQQHFVSRNSTRLRAGLPIRLEPEGAASRQPMVRWLRIPLKMVRIGHARQVPIRQILTKSSSGRLQGVTRPTGGRRQPPRGYHRRRYGRRRVSQALQRQRAAMAG